MRTALLLFLLALTGCAGDQIFGPTASLTTDEPQGVVIVGYSGNLSLGYVHLGKYDAETRKVTGWSKIIGGDLIGGRDAFTLTHFMRHERYHAFKMAPGEYAMVLIQGSKGSGGLFGHLLENTYAVDADSLKILDQTPVFTITAGEAVYIGELTVDYTSFPARLAVGVDDAGMRDFLKTRPGLQNIPVNTRLLVRYGGQKL